MKNIKTILLIFSIFLLIFFYSIRADVSPDEIEDYWLFSINKLYQGEFSESLSRLKNSDHFPLFFLYHGLLFHLFKSVFVLRIFALIKTIIALYFFYRALRLKNKSDNIFLLACFFFLFLPMNIYHIVFATKYTFAMMFLAISFYMITKTSEFPSRSNYIKTGVAFITTFFSHYLTTPIILFFILKIKNKKIKTCFLIGFILIILIVLFHFSNVMSKIDVDSGESQFTTLTSVVNEENKTTLISYINSIGSLFIHPGMYTSYNVNTPYNLIVGVFILFIFIIPVKKSKNIVHIIFFYITGFFLLTVFTELLWGIKVFEPDRLIFIAPFLSYFFAIVIIERKKIQKILIVFLLLIYATGIFNFVNSLPFDLQNIYRIAEKNNELKVYSSATRHQGRFDDVLLLKYYYKELQILNNIEGEEEFLFFSDFKYYDFPAKLSDDIYQNLIKKYNVKNLYSGQHFYLYHVKNTFK